MKRTLLTALVLTGTCALAQTPRLSLYEEFTGETCPPCAATNPGLNALLLTPANQQKIVAIKWQVPIPTSPTKPWSLYLTNQAEIDWRHLGWNGNYGNTTINPPSSGGYGYPSQSSSSSANITSGVNSAPSGRIDGQHQWVFGATSDHPATLTQGVINTAQSYTSAFSVTMTRAWDATYSAVDLTVSITASAPFTSVGNLVFRCVMVEREIAFDEQPGTNGEKFFEDVAVKSFPDLQNGTPLASNWILSQNTTFTLHCPLPSYIRDKAQVAFVGFIQDDGDRKVAQTVRADVDPLPNDAKAVSVQVSPFSCGTNVIPQVNVSNVGTNAITALTITPYLDGVAQPDFLWTGNINPGANTNIALNAINPTTHGGHNFDYVISGVSGGDMNQLNNAAKKGFYLVSGYNTTSPLVEDFALSTFPAPGYFVVNADAGPTWIRHATANGPSLSTGIGSAKYDFYMNTDKGDQDELLLPPQSFTLPYTPKLVFDVAYCQYSSTQPENDKLEVMVSKDCGASWSTVYNKAGTTLSTKAPQTGAFTPSQPAHWRTETVNLTGFANSDVIIKFVATADYGNNLYIDNINLSQECIEQNVTLNSSLQNSLCVGDELKLTAGGATSFQWSSGATGTLVTLIAGAPGMLNYTVKSTDMDACGDSATVQLTVIECVGLGEEASLAARIFPNPSNGDFTVENQGQGTANLILFNQLGQNMGEYTVQPGTTTIRSNLAPGMYLYTLGNSQGEVKKGSLVIK